MKPIVFFSLLSTLLLSNLIIAQPIIKSGDEVSFSIKKNPVVSSFSLNNYTAFILRTSEGYQYTYNMFLANNNGYLSDPEEIKIDVGTFKNMNDINSFIELENKMYMLVENRNKEEQKNTLWVRSVSEKGVVAPNLQQIGFIPYTRMIDPGTWLTYVTPDKKHLAIVAVYPKEKDQPQQGKYFFLDANFKVLSTGDISITSEKKKNYAFKLLASDYGDLYLINEEFDKTYKFPVVYRKGKNNKSFTEFACFFNDPIKNLHYESTISPTGSLIVAGYTQPKQNFRVGDVESNGVWIYNTDKPTEVATLPFEKNISNMRVTKLEFIEGNLYMVGEQIGEEKENRPPGSAMNFEENYLYKYGNIVVSVVDLAANTKYEIPLSRSFNSRNIIHDLTPAIGVIKNKLTLLYNDDYRKYQENVSAYKVPVLTSITTQGLLEQPVHLEKEFEAGPTGFNMLTRYNHVNQNTITTLLYNGYQLKAGVIKF